MVHDSPQTSVARTEQGELFPPERENPAPGKPAPENPVLTEELLKKDGPSDQRPKAPVDLVAIAVYEHADKMGNYMAIRQVAGRALKIDGATPESVQAAMCQAVDDSRPLTGLVVRDYMTRRNGTGPRDTHDAHWQSGGGFTADDVRTPT